MATDATTPTDDLDEVIDLATEQADGAAATGRGQFEQLRDAAEGAAGRTILREVPYAAVGLGKVVAGAARNLDTSSLPGRLRSAPTTVASKASAFGSKAKLTYLALAARGRAARAADAARDGGQHAAGATERAQGWFGRIKGTASRSSNEAAATSDPAPDGARGREAQDTTGGGDREALEEHTVSELRELASDLDIEGRASMRKQELIEAIREAD